MSEPLQPGRELDALIAEEVMGWVRVTYRKGARWSRGIPLGSIPALPIEKWAPSTNIADAWDVVEKAGLTNVDRDGASWVARHGFRASAHGWTAPHAICLAALAAVGVSSKRVCSVSEDKATIRGSFCEACWLLRGGQ